MKNIYDIYNIFESLTTIEDPRQFNKVKYLVEMVLIASLGNANEWTEIEIFCTLHEDILRKYFKMENGVPSHDTFQRVMGMIEPSKIQQIQAIWNEYISRNEGEGIKKILNIGLMSISWTQKVKLFYAVLLANNSHCSGVM